MDQYTETDCTRCTDGVVFDITNADKVATGGDGNTRCPDCRGTTKILTRINPFAAQHAAQTAALRAALAENYDPAAELPEWMR